MKKLIPLIVLLIFSCSQKREPVYIAPIDTAKTEVTEDSVETREYNAQDFLTGDTLVYCKAEIIRQNDLQLFADSGFTITQSRYEVKIWKGISRYGLLECHKNDLYSFRILIRVYTHDLDRWRKTSYDECDSWSINVFDSTNDTSFYAIKLLGNFEDCFQVFCDIVRKNYEEKPCGN